MKWPVLLMTDERQVEAAVYWNLSRDLASSGRKRCEHLEMIVVPVHDFANFLYRLAAYLAHKRKGRAPNRIYLNLHSDQGVNPSLKGRRYGGRRRRDCAFDLDILGNKSKTSYVRCR